MRAPTILMLAALFSASANAAEGPRAPEPGQPPAQTPGQDAAQKMIQVYEEFCLTRFPSAPAVTEGVTAHRMDAATPEQAAAALLGRAGAAWRLTTPKGRYLVAMESSGRQGCAVVGDVADDAGTRATFDLLVTAFAKAHEFGALQKPPLQQGTVAGAAATLQLIGAAPDGHPRQAFVNMANGSGDAQHVRLTREYAPPAQASAAPAGR